MNEHKPIVIASPNLFRNKLKTYDGEIRYLFSGLQKTYEDIRLFDGYRFSEQSISHFVSSLNNNPVIIVHLWKVDILDGELNNIEKDLEDLRKISQAVIVCGYLGEALSGELFDKNLCDAVVTADDVLRNETTSQNQFLMSLCQKIQKITAVFEDVLCNNNSQENYTEDEIVSILGSRGCNANCTFCAYNKNLSKNWTPRPVDHICNEIEFLYGRGARKIAFADNDFGGTLQECRSRVDEIYYFLESKDLLKKILFSINAREETLDEHILHRFANIGIKNILIGVESFNPDTRKKFLAKG